MESSLDGRHMRNSVCSREEERKSYGRDKRDYYEVLGRTARTLDDADIKKAYRTLAKKYHPDMQSGG